MKVAEQRTISESKIERRLIHKSMRKWESIDMTGRHLGRGLGKKELIDRVAKEVGKTLREVYAALKCPL